MSHHVLTADYIRTETKDYIERMRAANEKRMNLTHQELMNFFRYNAMAYVVRKAVTELETLLRTQRNLYMSIYTRNPVLTDWTKEEVDMFRAYQIYRRTYIIDSIPEVGPKYQHRLYNLDLPSTFKRRGTPIITDSGEGITRDKFHGIGRWSTAPSYLRN